MAKKQAGRRRPAAAKRSAAGSTRARGRKPVRRPATKRASAKRPTKTRAAKPRPKARAKAPSRPSKTRAAKPKARTTKAAPARTERAPRPTPPRPRSAPSLDRSRRHLPEFEDNIPTPPSSLDLDRTPSAARSGRQGALVTRSQHNETSPELTGGDVDASWEDAYAVGDEAPGGDNPTPDQDRVDDIGKALGVEYQDNEELKASEKITKRDKHRWELDPASAEDYNDRDVD
jgi:Family of unknown function (DUF6335)